MNQAQATRTTPTFAAVMHATGTATLVIGATAFVLSVLVALAGVLTGADLHTLTTALVGVGIAGLATTVLTGFAAYIHSVLTDFTR